MKTITKSRKSKAKKKDKQKKLEISKAYLHYCSVTELAVNKALCQESFVDFAKFFWDEVVPEQLHWNWHLDVLCNELQVIAERVFRNEEKQYDLFINVPPGSSKSTFGSILYTPWLWTRMATCRMIGGSFDKELSLEFGTKCRRIIRSDRFREMWPHIELRKDQDTKSFFENTLGGQRRATSVGANITGRHAHIIVIDDPLNPTGARSEADITTAKNWMKETVPSRSIDLTITPLVCIMQRLALDDPTGERLARSKLFVPDHELSLAI